MPNNLPNQPHFRYPFKFGSGLSKHALVNEQDSEDDIIACVLAIVKTPRGFRDDIPDFGITEQIFKELPLRAAEIQAALEEWEERAAYKVTTDNDFSKRLTAQLTIMVKSRTDA